MNIKERIKFLEQMQATVQANIERTHAMISPITVSAIEEINRIVENLVTPSLIDAISKAAEAGEQVIKSMESVRLPIPDRDYTPLLSVPTEDIWIERQERHNSFKMAIEEKEGEIFIYGKYANLNKKNSYEYLLLLALLTCSNEKGFCSYEAIYNFFMSRGKKRILTKQKREKQIHNVKADLVRGKVRRNIQIPTTPEGLKLIDIVTGEGLLFRNFVY